MPATAPLRATIELTVSPLGEGHSNLTYDVAAGRSRWVLRRPPAGPLLPTAHDVVREYRVGWESTLLDLPQVHFVLRALFAPVVGVVAIAVVTTLLLHSAIRAAVNR